MECKKVEDLLSDYIENDLPRELRLQVTRHLEQCPTCTRLMKKMEDLVYALPNLEDDVPFFLRNRLYYIPESQEEPQVANLYLKWVAAVIGTFALCLNLFYFTNIYPPANRALHSLVTDIEYLVVRTGAFLENITESKDLIFSSLSANEIEREAEPRREKEKKLNKNVIRGNNGGKNG